MLQQKLVDLKDFILKYNPYMNKGFSDVSQDGDTGIINNEKKIIFPSDTFGNYFYLRSPSELKGDYSKPIADNGLSIGLVGDVILVAYLKNGNADVLAGNMATSIGRFQGFNTRINKITVQKDLVIYQELSKLKKEVKSAALQKSRESVIISIQFSINSDFIFQSLNCIQDPCKC